MKISVAELEKLLRQGPLPERFTLVVIYQEGDYLYGKNCPIKSLATVLRDPRRRHWMEHLDEDEIPFPEDKNLQRTIVVNPHEKEEMAMIYFGEKKFIFKDGTIYWDGKIPAPPVSREKLIKKVFDLILAELEKICQIQASPAWLKDIKLEQNIFTGEGLKLYRNYIGTSANSLSDSILIEIDGERFSNAHQLTTLLKKKIEKDILEKFLNSSLKNFNCPDWLPASMVFSDQFEKIKPQKTFQPIDIPEIKELFEKISE